MLGVDRAQVSRWTSSSEPVSAEMRRRIVDLHDILTRILRVYSRDAAALWLVSNPCSAAPGPWTFSFRRGLPQSSAPSTESRKASTPSVVGASITLTCSLCSTSAILPPARSRELSNASPNGRPRSWQAVQRFPGVSGRSPDTASPKTWRSATSTTQSPATQRPSPVRCGRRGLCAHPRLGPEDLRTPPLGAHSLVVLLRPSLGQRRLVEHGPADFGRRRASEAGPSRRAGSRPNHLSPHRRNPHAEMNCLSLR